MDSMDPLERLRETVFKAEESKREQSNILRSVKHVPQVTRQDPDIPDWVVEREQELRGLVQQVERQRQDLEARTKARVALVVPWLDDHLLKNHLQRLNRELESIRNAWLMEYYLARGGRRPDDWEEIFQSLSNKFLANSQKEIQEWDDRWKPFPWEQNLPTLPEQTLDEDEVTQAVLEINSNTTIDRPDVTLMDAYPGEDVDLVGHFMEKIKQKTNPRVLDALREEEEEVEEENIEVIDLDYSEPEQQMEDEQLESQESLSPLPEPQHIPVDSPIDSPVGSPTENTRITPQISLSPPNFAELEDIDELDDDHIDGIDEDDYDEDDDGIDVDDIEDGIEEEDDEDNFAPQNLTNTHPQTQAAFANIMTGAQFEALQNDNFYDLDEIEYTEKAEDNDVSMIRHSDHSEDEFDSVRMIEHTAEQSTFQFDDTEDTLQALASQALGDLTPIAEEPQDDFIEELEGQQPVVEELEKSREPEDSVVEEIQDTGPEGIDAASPQRSIELLDSPTTNAVVVELLDDTPQPEHGEITDPDYEPSRYVPSLEPSVEIIDVLDAESRGVSPSPGVPIAISEQEHAPSALHLKSPLQEPPEPKSPAPTETERPLRINFGFDITADFDKVESEPMDLMDQSIDETTVQEFEPILVDSSDVQTLQAAKEAKTSAAGDAPAASDVSPEPQEETNPGYREVSMHDMDVSFNIVPNFDQQLTSEPAPTPAKQQMDSLKYLDTTAMLVRSASKMFGKSPLFGGKAPARIFHSTPAPQKVDPRTISQSARRVFSQSPLFGGATPIKQPDFSAPQFDSITKARFKMDKAEDAKFVHPVVVNGENQLIEEDSFGEPQQLDPKKLEPPVVDEKVVKSPQKKTAARKTQEQEKKSADMELSESKESSITNAPDLSAESVPEQPQLRRSPRKLSGSIPGARSASPEKRSRSPSKRKVSRPVESVESVEPVVQVNDDEMVVEPEVEVATPAPKKRAPPKRKPTKRSPVKRNTRSSKQDPVKVPAEVAETEAPEPEPVASPEPEDDTPLEVARARPKRGKRKAETEPSSTTKKPKPEPTVRRSSRLQKK